MSEPVIRASGLGKKYTISHQGRSRSNYTALRDVMAEKACVIAGSILHPFAEGNGGECSAEELWALKNLDFEVNEGDRVGIIGRNGAGKTTLLKILSRITEPSAGDVFISGRVASLLEVGTGFHPELTGRENIFMNGAILGMTGADIKKKFDEIVDFAEVEKFLDTPVKRYSSGMYVRLAFAVAAHLEPDILIVDEVLAVGDAGFQKKCLGRMRDAKREGRTLLFVSHNMGMIRELTARGMWLHDGELRFYGASGDAADKYLAADEIRGEAAVDLSEHRNRVGGMKKILKRVSLKTSGGGLSNDFTQADSVVIEVEYDAAPAGVNIAGVGFILTSDDGVRVGSFNTYMSFKPPYSLPAKGSVAFEIAPRQLNPGAFYITVSIGSHPIELEDKVESAVSFTVHPADIYGTGYLLEKSNGVAALSVNSKVSDGRIGDTDIA